MTTPKTLNVLESNMLLDMLLKDSGTHTQKRKGIRNYLIGLLMLDAGLRVGEVSQLLITDLAFFNLPVQSVCVRAEIAKGGHQRTVPCSQRIRHGIVSMLNAWWLNSDIDPAYYAFYHSDNHFNLSRRQIERIIKRAGLVSIGREINPHALRHTFATRLMRTVNSRIVQKLLGHKNLSSTEVYTHPSQEDLTKAIESIDEPRVKIDYTVSNTISQKT